MNVRNCRKCGALFNYVMGPIICPACHDAMEAKFKEVKEYIQKNPGVGLKQTSEACEVEVSQIQQWIREERLEFSSDSMVTLACESCGATIRSGRFCDKCKNSLANGFRQSVARPEAPKVEKKDPRDAARMRFLG